MKELSMKNNKPVALITGGSKGIGLEAVKRFVSLGYQVVTCSRQATVWLEKVKEFSNLADVDYLALDISLEVDRDRLFSHVEKQYSHLDVVINNASPTLESSGPYEDQENRALEHTLMQDFWAHATCLKQALSMMKKGGAIVNMSSINGFRATPNAAMYSACKHAIEGLTRSVAIEAIGKGVRVNAVAPGVTWTPRWELRAQDTPDLRANVSAQVPAKRFAHEAEIVDAVEFLTSKKASYIVGHTLVVDGGLSLI